MGDVGTVARSPGLAVANETRPGPPAPADPTSFPPGLREPLIAIAADRYPGGRPYQVLAGRDYPEFRIFQGDRVIYIGYHGEGVTPQALDAFLHRVADGQSILAIRVAPRHIDFARATLQGYRLKVGDRSYPRDRLAGVVFTVCRYEAIPHEP